MKLLFCILILCFSTSPIDLLALDADVFVQPDNATRLKLEDFGRYFRSSYNVDDTIELELRFSREFIGQFQDSCRISAMMSMIHPTMGATGKEAIFLISFRELSPPALTSQSFYIAGFKGEFEILLHYDVVDCEFDEGNFYKNLNSIMFVVDDIAKLKNSL